MWLTMEPCVLKDRWISPDSIERTIAAAVTQKLVLKSRDDDNRSVRPIPAVRVFVGMSREKSDGLVRAPR